MDLLNAAEIVAGAAAGLGLVAGGCAYASMWPTSQIYGRVLTAPPRPGELALTFDDGPHPTWTPQLLDLLAQHGVKASFFLLGRHAAQHPDLVRRLAAEGHLVGNHSWSHPNLARTAAAKVLDELTRTSALLEDLTGQPVRCFRPPYGGRRPAVLRMARQLGMEPILWNAMTSDWKEPSAERIAQRLGAKVESWQRKGRATTLVLHDGAESGFEIDRTPSVNAARLLLERFCGTHRFVRVDAWL